MAGAVEESKLDVHVPFHEGRAAGQQPGSAAGARGSGAAEARARPNVEVNRRAEGASELNRRLGAVEKGAGALERCSAAVPPGIMAGTEQESKRRSISGQWADPGSSRPATGQHCRSASEWSVKSQSHRPGFGSQVRFRRISLSRISLTNEGISFSSACASAFNFS